MGATESIFYDEDPPVNREYPTHSYPNPHDARHRKPNGGPNVARRPKLRTRPRPGGANDLPSKTMQGLVLGGARSGKHTLLERLKGKDPFENPEAEKNGALVVGDPFEPKPNAVAVVPYQAPPACPVWDRLQLNVQTAREVSLEGSINFSVILINPHDGPSKIQAYLIQVISDLIKHHLIDLQSNKTRDVPQPHQALCLCFLVNFRDQVSKKNRGIQESDVKQCVKGILQQMAEHLPSPDQVLLQFGTTSLRNCYGLATLHHFIYSAYMRTKRNELEQQLFLVQTELAKPHAAPRLKYKDFLKIVDESNAADHQEKDRQSSAHRSGMHQSVNVKQDFNRLQGHTVDGAQDQSHNSMPQAQGRRMILEQTQESALPPPDLPKYENSRQALEDFLASDEDDVAIKSKAARRGSSNYEEEDEDEDDFFYNEVGERCTAQVRKPAKHKQQKSAEASNRQSRAKVGPPSAPAEQVTPVSTLGGRSSEEESQSNGHIQETQIAKQGLSKNLHNKMATTKSIPGGEQNEIAENKNSVVNLEEKQGKEQKGEGSKGDSPAPSSSGDGNKNNSQEGTEQPRENQNGTEDNQLVEHGHDTISSPALPLHAAADVKLADKEPTEASESPKSADSGGTQCEDESQNDQIPDVEATATQATADDHSSPGDRKDEQDEDLATYDGNQVATKNEDAAKARGSGNLSDSEGGNDFFVGQNIDEDVQSSKEGTQQNGKGEASMEEVGTDSTPTKISHDEAATLKSKADDSNGEEDLFFNDSAQESGIGTAASATRESKAIAKRDANDSDDEDEFFIGESGIGNEANVADAVACSNADLNSARSQDGELSVTQESKRQDKEPVDEASATKDPKACPTVASPPASPSEEDFSSNRSPKVQAQPATATNNASLSAAALVAIAAAQREAELMLHISRNNPENTEKKSKSKKSKSKQLKKEKKKAAKKEKKTKRVGQDE